MENTVRRLHQCHHHHHQLYKSSLWDKNNNKRWKEHELHIVTVIMT